ncbi:InlB B-repeat-containing protein [Aurantimicrobium minutum]|uniref:InlB B-repeat-containing protein n=1 Tax=Aurantimicrobium minutum TaxID=708131 RepID=UPI0024761B59|nr:InlB B-repeat-containing protein [Aurantimicrobium minutum]
MDIALWFGTVPTAAFSGNSFTLRVDATCEKQGYGVYFVVGKNTVQTTTSANLIGVFNTGTVPGCNTTSTVKNYTVTVTDSQKAQIQAGDFAIIVGAVGSGSGALSTQEVVSKVSIPYSLINLSYDPNGGAGSVSTQSVGLQSTLTTNSFTRSGYTFAGWNTVAGGTGTSYADGASATFSGDTTLYAQWTATPVSSPAAASSSSQTLANTGSSKAILLGMFGISTVLGLLMVAHSIRRRQRS